MTNEMKNLLNELNETLARMDAAGKAAANYNNDLNNHYWKEYEIHSKRAKQLKGYILSQQHREVKIGDGITLNLWSDSNAYTVISRTDKTLTLQRDKATLKEDWKPEFIQGGFAAHCVNQYEQEYDYKPDAEGQIIKIRWSEKTQRWNAPRGYRSVSLGRHEFYDYNF